MQSTVWRLAPAALLSVILGASSPVQANIVGTTQAGFASASHNDVASNPIQIFNQSVSGFPISLTSPLTVSNTGYLDYVTQASIQAGLTINTPTVLQYDSYYAGDTQMSGAGLNGMGGNARVYLNSQISFTLDAPGTVTLTSYNTTQSTFVQFPLQGNAGCGKLFWLDNNLVHAAYSNGSYVIPVSAGAHFFEEIQDVISIFSGPANSASAFGSSRSRLRIESVPEPTSLLAVGLGVAVLLRRRKGR